MQNIISENIWGKYSIPHSISYTYTAQTIIEGRVHEDTTIDYIKSIGGNIIHAGSGFGDFLPALKDCQKVWTFEPNPLMYQSTLETISLNKLNNIELFPFALGKNNGTITLKNIDETGQEMGPRTEIGEGIEVELVKLDTIIPNVEKISLIHLDLEGYEFQALDGAKEIIERDRPIIVLEIDTRAVDYNNYMLSIGYFPHKQLIFNSSERMVFVNTVYMPIEKKEISKDYWSSDIPRPLSPDDVDVEIYKSYLTSGETLLLGCTKKLISISDHQMDLYPQSPDIIQGNWIDNKEFYQNIIGDGVLSFTKELSDKIIEMAAKHCKVFIARTFTKRLPTMKIANHFPTQNDFKIKPTVTLDFENYSFYIWYF